MKNNKLEQLIEMYGMAITTAGKNSAYDEVQKNLEELGKEVELLDHDYVEREILSYIKHNLVTKSWKNAQHWIGAALIHPSSRYLDCFLMVLSEEDPNAPHYWVLDVIQYMPENISNLALPALKKLSEQINSSWSAAVIEKYFETVVWNDENAEDFISTLVTSNNELVAFRAKYWMETFEVERKEEEDLVGKETDD
ncbi:hypothetical protein [Brevibacillus brevis]|uniref:hypothetical protein n=1 Tax=Brevibacillus brevis TaxID=1393 RepID=UPI000E37D526|nr:hypothetical protein [Brevibacillus brevis]RED29220.1 hypothetical protein DES34_1064 [Brevibacillus brevis]GEC93892.1 hypothetical protein BBR01nite_62230 [Brevibacillus brevis]VEF87821.1 Uncharacterised protein [Brevibacillus brevis]